MSTTFHRQALALCLILAGCNSVAPARDPVKSFEDLVQRGLECLQEKSDISSPQVSFDVTKTDSLITPLQGVIYVTYSKVPSPNMWIYEVDFGYTDDKWAFVSFVDTSGGGAPHHACFR